MFFAEPDSVPSTADHAWVSLQDVQEVQGWMDLNDAELRRLLQDKPAHTVQGAGVCLVLALGGEIYMHTNGEGEVVLDVTEEAAWAAPVISAATGVPAPAGQMWILPAHAAIPLLLGLNSLIASSRLVLAHAFKHSRRY